MCYLGSIRAIYIVGCYTSVFIWLYHDYSSRKSVAEVCQCLWKHIILCSKKWIQEWQNRFKMYFLPTLSYPLLLLVIFSDHWKQNEKKTIIGDGWISIKDRSFRTIWYREKRQLRGKYVGYAIGPWSSKLANYESPSIEEQASVGRWSFSVLSVNWKPRTYLERCSHSFILSYVLTLLSY